MFGKYFDLLLYAVHLLFWGTFGVTRLWCRSQVRPPSADGNPAAAQAQTVAFSRILLALPMLAFAAMYTGVANAVVPNRVPTLFPGQRAAGTLIILAGAALMSWALVHLQSWRFRAKLDPGHILATQGPFKYLRHPIYMGMNLLAFGTAIWVPTLLVSASVVLMVLGSDLRARAEEKLLRTSFGQAYIDYARHTRRFLPGIY